MHEFKISISKAISSKGIEIELQDFNTKSQWSTCAKLTSPQSNNKTYKDTVFSTDRLSVINDYEEELSFSYLLCCSSSMSFSRNLDLKNLDS